VLVRVGDAKDWVHAKWVWKSSWFMMITVNDHLMVTHLREANAFAKATQLRFPVDHVLRPFLKPFTFQTVSVNKNAVASLINERGFVHRVWAFEYPVFVKACKLMHDNYKFRRMQDYIDDSMKKLGDNDYPINADAEGFWKVVYTYVNNFFKFHPGIFESAPSFVAQLEEDLSSPRQKLEIKDEAKLKEVITQLIVNGTAKHELVGQVSDYTNSPRFVGCKLQPNMEINNVQTYTQLMALTLLTGFRMPQLKDDWGHLFKNDEDVEVYELFRTDLLQFEKEVRQRNKNGRKHVFNFFNPQYLECSVSI